MDDLGEAMKPKIERRAESVKVAGGRQATVPSVVVRCRADQIRHLKIAPNGKYLILGTRFLFSGGESAASFLFLIDLEKGQLVTDFSSGSSDISEICFSPNSRWLVQGEHLGRNLRIHDVHQKDKDLSLGDYQWCGGSKWSPDGKVLAFQGNHAETSKACIEMLDGSTWKRLSTIQDGQDPVWTFAFTEDSNVLVTKHYSSANIKGGEKTIRTGSYRLWDVKTGKPLGRLGSREDLTDAEVGFADGARLRRSSAGKAALFPPFPVARVRQEENRRIILTETRSDRAFLELASPEPSWHIAKVELASPPNYLVAQAHERDWKTTQGGGDWAHRITLQFWDMSELLAERKAEPTPLSQEELLRAWSDLAAADVSRAHKAMSRLLGASEQLGQFLKERVQPVPACSAEQVKKWIAELNSDSFQSRVDSALALTTLGERAAPELEDRLRDPDCPLEVRRRIEQILEKAKEPELVSGDTGRMLWVVELLEQWGTSEAKMLLENLASGPLNAWVTSEAKASLARINKLSE